MNLQLKQIRKMRGLSQEDMADRLGVKVSRYGTWERGERMMSVEQAFNCAIILECTLDEIAGLDAPAPAANYPGEVYARLNDRGKASLAEQAYMHDANPMFQVERDSSRVG